MISRHLDVFQETPADDPAFLVQGEYFFEETWIFLEDPALYMSLDIMLLNTIVLVVVYHRKGTVPSEAAFYDWVTYRIRCRQPHG